VEFHIHVYVTVSFEKLIQLGYYKIYNSQEKRGISFKIMKIYQVRILDLISFFSRQCL